MLKTISLFILTFLILSLMFFLPAGTLSYWQGWLYIAVVLIPGAGISYYLIKFNPELAARRMNFHEKLKSQKKIIGISYPIFIVAFLVPGFDFRFGWSNVPVWLVAGCSAIVFLCYMLVFWVFRVNTYTSRTLEVFKGQKVISTGPYAIIRHPMYLGALGMWVFSPLALGSFWAVPFFLPLIAIIVARIKTEEKFLKKNLPGYKEYVKKIRYRLIPFIW